MARGRSCTVDTQESEAYCEAIEEFRERCVSNEMSLRRVLRSWIETAELLDERLLAVLNDRPLTKEELGMGYEHGRAQVQREATKLAQPVATAVATAVEGVEVCSGPPPVSAGRGKGGKLQSILLQLPELPAGEPGRFVKIDPEKFSKATVASVVSKLRREQGLNLRSYPIASGEIVVVRDTGKAEIKSRRKQGGVDVEQD